MASFIYQHLFHYRLAMMFLYTGSYYARARRLCALISRGPVLELCFADTLVAAHCRKNQIPWTGVDVNKKFVHCALKKGYQARLADIHLLDSLPEAGTCLISGSLYQFYESASVLIRKMLKSAPCVIICEPVKNLSASRGLSGRLARFFSTSHAGRAPRRFDRNSLLELIGQLAETERFSYQIADTFKKDMTIILTR